MVVSPNTCLKVTPKKLKYFPEVIWKCRKNPYQLIINKRFLWCQVLRSSNHSHLKSIMHSFQRSILILKRQKVHIPFYKQPSC